MTQKEVVGKRFKDFRKLIGKTQKEIAAEADMSQANIAKIEKGEIFPNLEILIYLYGKHNLNIHWIISGNGEAILSQRDYGEYTQDMNELLFYLDNNPSVRYSILKYFLIYKYKHQDSLPPIEKSENKFNIFEVHNELSRKNRGDD